MTDLQNGSQVPGSTEPSVATPKIHISTHDHGFHFSLIWIIPIVAAAVGIYLFSVSWLNRGPVITIRFQSADGIEVGKTQVKHKNVVLGAVEGMSLSDDLKAVKVSVEMTKEAAPYLGKDSRFWIERPRFSVSEGVSGLSTIVSGPYIEFDPGEKGSEAKFVGLEEPPVVQSDVPGTEFVLDADRLGPIGIGSPIYYRDVQVGQVMGYNSSHLDKGVTISIFVRAPYDKQVFKGTRFWNASGISLDSTPRGFKLEFTSLQTVLIGGIVFDTDPDARKSEVAPPDTKFSLFKDLNAFEDARYTERHPFLIFFDGSITGLGPGSSVEWRGIKVGQVTDIKMQYVSEENKIRIPVTIEIEPQRGELVGTQHFFDNPENLKDYVRHGLRAQIKSSNLLTGQAVVSLDIHPDAPAAELDLDGATPVLPSIPTWFESSQQSVTTILKQVQDVPLQTAAEQATATLKSAHDFIDHANSLIDPLKERFPELATAAQQALQHANMTLGSIETGYGAKSPVNKELQAVLLQVNDAVRSVRILSDYIEQHPESIFRGKSN